MHKRLANPAAVKDWRGVWYGLAVWRTMREHQLSKEPLCAICFEQGCVTPATVADHVEPHLGDWNKFRLGPLRSLCKEHHDGLQPAFKHRGYRLDIGPDGYPLDPAHPFYRGRV